MKKVFLTALAVTSLAPTIVSKAVPNIGVIDMQEIVMLLPEFQKASDEFEAFRKVLEAEAKNKMEKFQKQIEGMPKDPSLMTEAQKAEVQAMYAQFQKLEEDMKARTEAKQQALVKPIFDKVNAAIKKVRKNNGLSMVFNSTSVVDFDPSCNISDNVLKELGILDPEAARKQLKEKNAAPKAGAKTVATPGAKKK